MEKFLKLANDTQLFDGVKMKVTKGHNALKVYLETPGAHKIPSNKVSWWAPFVDLFLFKEDTTTTSNGDVETQIRELSPKLKVPKGTWAWQAFKSSTSSYYPSQAYYYGGEWFQGPQTAV